MIEPHHPDLPDAIRAEKPRSEEEAAQYYRRVQSLSLIVAGKRDAAVKARTESGIEDIWTACEEAYAGIDDVNRKAGQGQQWRKPTSPTGPLTRSVSKDEGQRSTVYIRLTTRYVDMGAAKVKEKALPIDDKPFKLSPTPKPDMVLAGEQEDAPVPAANPMAAAMGQQPGPAAQPGADPMAALAGGMPGMPGVPGAPAMAAAKPDPDAKARKAADKAADRIFDWLSESKYPQHIRRVIDDGARIGVGVLKGPFPDVRSAKSFSVKDGVGMLEMVSKTAPGCTWIDPWNFFPAANCGEDIHRGDYVFERDFLSESKLEELKKLRGLPTEKYPAGEPIYLAEQIDHVISEGPDKRKLTSDKAPGDASRKDAYTVWHYTGSMSRQDMIDLGAIGAEELPAELVSCNAIVTMVNDTVIRAQMNPLEKSGNFPYRVFCWSRRAGFWAGVGIAEQVMVPQSMVNAGTRAWLNNAGVSSGVQLVVDTGRIEPADNNLSIGGGIKVWVTNAEGQGMDVRQLMSAVQIPNLGNELMAIINYAFKLAEEMSNIPLVSQGQTGPQDPQTFGQAELQNNNANTLLRQVADTLDGNVIEPTVEDFYEYLLLDPDVPVEEKGDFQIIAKGSSAMVEKAIQEQTLMMLGPMTLNPAYGFSPARWAEEVARAKRLDPERLKLSDEEKARMASQQPPMPPQVQVAQIREQGANQRAEMANQTALQRAKMDTDRDTVYVESERQRNVDTIHARMQELALKRELALLDYANKRDISLEQVKADLAKTAMQLNTQKELAGMDGQGPQVATPATEPPGRAPNGEAFQL